MGDTQLIAIFGGILLANSAKVVLHELANARDIGTVPRSKPKRGALALIASWRYCASPGAIFSYVAVKRGSATYISPRPIRPSSVSTSTTALVRPQSRPKRQVSGGIKGTDTT